VRFDPAADAAIVIPVHNRRDITKRCIDSLRDADGDEVALIVVDDGSNDGTAEYLAAQEGLTALSGTGDLWWTGSVDLGCRHAVSAGARVILLLNDDNIVAPDLVPVLLAAVETTRGCVSAVVLERQAGFGGSIFQAGGTLNWRRRGIGLRQTGALYRQDERTEDCEWLPGCALGFPSEVFVELRGFDTRRFPHYRGDIDFTVRARSRGYRCCVTFGTWVENDCSDSPLTFRTRVHLNDYLRGFVIRRSNYNLKETVRFAWRHCPKQLLLFHLLQFYARYTWAALKTQRLAFARWSRTSRAEV
jgi:GT2 family glycosyltransferase